MKLFKKLDVANRSSVQNYIGSDQLLRLANVVVIETEDSLLFAKYDSDKYTDIHDKVFYEYLCELDFVTITSDKHLSAEDILNLYDKNVRVLVTDKTNNGIKIFKMRMLNQD